MQNLPTGTVTFLFTDIEGSTRLWQEKPRDMAISHALHDEILRESIENHHGFIFQTAGDSFNAAFHNAVDGLNAALQAQRALARMLDEGGRINKASDSSFIVSPSSLALKVRMGLHTGAAEILLDGEKPNYSGYATIATTQRVMSVAHGGQILLSQPTRDLLHNELPEGISLRDMGEHSLKDLRMLLHLYQPVTSDLPQDFPPLESLNSIPNNLPLQLTSFVGREKEIAEIKSLLGSARLVTLTGSGGTGKTRLSQEVSAQALTNFPQGVWLIELASLTDSGQIVPALAQTLGLHELPFQQLAGLVTDYLREKKALLILDNCEHLINACARLADELLHHCATLKILVSSREALGIAGEVAYRIPSLADTESTQLFVERARAANTQFQLTDLNAASIAQICSRLDGIPLAIELAAARTRLLSPEQIASKLDDRFRLLVGGNRTALPRQQTLRALIDWSYELLSEEEKHLLQFASVFIGGWTLDALEAVTDDPNAIEYLEGLVNKSLVVTEEHKSEMRYSMLETIRQYAREKLLDAQQASTARDRHFAYFNKLSEKLWEAFRSYTMYAWRDRAIDDMENLRAAFEWGLEHHTETPINLAANFGILSSWTGNQIDGLAVLDSALERFQSLSPVEGEAGIARQRLLSKTLFIKGTVSMATGRIPTALQTLQEAISLARTAGDKRMLGYSLEMYYTASTFRRIPEAANTVKEGYDIFREIDDDWGMGMALMNMARVALTRGDFDESQKYFNIVRERMKDAPASFMVGISFLGLGYDERYRGRLENAKKHFEDGLKVFQQLRHKGFATVMMAELGHIARTKGEMTEAKQIYHQTLKAFQDWGNRGAIAHQLECFAFIAIHDEDPQHAARLLGAAEIIREGIDSQMTESEHDEYDKSVARLHSMLEEGEFMAHWAEGRALSMERAIQLALS